MVKVVLTDKQAEYIDDRTRHLMVMGSAGSGKTRFACTKVILFALEYDGAQIGVFRRTMPSLKKTSWKVIESLLKKYNIHYSINKSDAIITFDNDSEIMFIPVDDDEKLRSLTLDMVYIEQCEEISYDEYQELNLRIRGEVYLKHWGQMLVVVQPGNKRHWLYRLFYQLHAYDPDYKYVHFSYLENPYLPKEQLKQYEDMKRDNPEKYRTHALGEWISNSKQIFVDNWKVGGLRTAYNYYVGGVDWGYSNPACFLLTGWYDDQCYVLGEVYGAEMKTSEFLEKIDNLLAKHNLHFGDIYSVYADSADPEKIKTFCDAGLNTYPSIKNVKAKISVTQETNIHIDESCTNLLDELPDYEWKKNKDGDLLEEPKKENDHAVDALCYACFGVRGKTSDYTPNGSVSIEDIFVR